jgi:hypothetical protein
LDSAVGSGGADSRPPTRVAGGGVLDPGPAGRAREGKRATSGEHHGSRLAQLREHPQAERWTRALLVLCTLVLLAATLEIVIDAAVGHSVLIPKQPAIAGWLSGLGTRLGYRTFLIALLAFTGAYALLLGLVGQISRRWAIGLVGVLQLIVFVGPVLV